MRGTRRTSTRREITMIGLLKLYLCRVSTIRVFGESSARYVEKSSSLSVEIEIVDRFSDVGRSRT